MGVTRTMLLAAFLAVPHVRHVQKGRTLQPDVDEGRLHARQHARDLAQVHVADQAPLQRALHVQFLHGAVSFGSVEFGEDAFLSHKLVFQEMRAAKAYKDAGEDGEEAKRPPYQER